MAKAHANARFPSYRLFMLEKYWERGNWIGHVISTRAKSLRHHPCVTSITVSVGREKRKIISPVFVVAPYTGTPMLTTS